MFVEGFEGVVVAAADADVAAQRVDPAVAVEREASQEEPDFGDLDGAEPWAQHRERNLGDQVS